LRDKNEGILLTEQINEDLIKRIQEGLLPPKMKHKKVQQSITIEKSVSEEPLIALRQIPQDDIFEGVGRYTNTLDGVPSDSDEDLEALVRPKSLQVEHAINYDTGINESKKNTYFSSKKDSYDEDKAAEEDLMDPVKKIIRSQMMKEHIANKRRIELEQDDSIKIHEDGKVHRDLIGGLNGHARGDISMKSGTYDVYPENGDYEVIA
jgi:hypothetical protein